MRLEQLTFTRFIAALSIVIFHYGKGSVLFNNEFVSTIFSQANIGVSYFFILSGFVMIVAYGDNVKISAISYLKNRFARIYPAYFLAIFIMLFFWILAHSFDFTSFFLNLFMIQAWIPERALTFNVPGWSLSVELFFYLLLLFFFNRIYKKFSLKQLILPITGFWLLSQVLHLLIQTTYSGLPFAKDMLYFPVMHLNEFLVGNLAGLFFMQFGRNSKRNFDIQVVLIFCLLLLVLKVDLGDLCHNGMLAVLFVPLIVLIAMNNGKITTLFNLTPLVFLGEISYGIYIFHFPVWS